MDNEIVNTRICKAYINKKIVKVASFTKLRVGQQFKLYEADKTPVAAGRVMIVLEKGYIGKDGVEAIKCDITNRKRFKK